MSSRKWPLNPTAIHCLRLSSCEQKSHPCLLCVTAITAKSHVGKERLIWLAIASPHPARKLRQELKHSRNLEAGTKAMIMEGGRLLAAPSFLTQDHLPSGTHQQGPPTFAINQENLSQTCLQASLMKIMPGLRFCSHDSSMSSC